jgi:hypothetical protein
VVHKAHPDEHPKKHEAHVGKPHPEQPIAEPPPEATQLPAPEVRYERPPPKPGMVRVKMQKLTDEVNHGTTSYPVDTDGIVDLPPEAAAIVIKQGGAELVNPPPPPVEGTIQVQHISDPATIVGHGDQSYAPSGGVLTVPLAIWPEIEPHGFVAIPT